MEHLESVARQNIRRIYVLIYGYLNILSLDFLSPLRFVLTYTETVTIINHLSKVL